MTISEAISKRVYQLCRERGITTDGLSDISGVSRDTMKNILNGKSKELDISIIKSLCGGLNVTLREFFSAPEFEQSQRKEKQEKLP